MPTPVTLPISRLISASVNLSPLGAQTQNLSKLLVLGSTAHIDVAKRMVEFTSLSNVTLEFAANTPEYLAAQAWFSQVPQPTSILIGRWAKTATAGQLIGAPISAANQVISVWTAITNGAFKVTVDGGLLQSITALNFSAATNMNGVAAIIQAAVTGATVVWDALEQYFIFTSNTTGASSTVSFLTAGASGTDISGLLGGLSTSSGAYVANGIVAETALSAVNIFDNMFGQQWYGLVIPEGADSDHTAVAGFIEAAANKHVYGVGTIDANVLSAVATSDIAYVLKALGYKKTMVQYSSTSVHAVSSLLGRILTTNYSGNNTTITLMYKTEPGIVAENLSSSALSALEGKNCNVFVAYNNNTAIIEQGKVCSGEFIDTITGTDAWALSIQTAVYNVLYTSTNKIPQTDAGNNILVAAIEGINAQFVTNGFLAPGVWGSAGFGALSQGDFMPKGYYTYAPPVATQSAADRAARKSTTIQVAGKLAGAIHTVDIVINVNR